MSRFFYSKLALSNIRKNGKIYIPYILTCIGTVMMYYIIYSLASDEAALSNMRGGESLGSMLMLGTFVIVIFSMIFLFYTNSFIIKRRKKEIGLYNVLGMDKRHIARVLVLETIFIEIISLVVGILLGILFSKAALLFLLKLLNFDVKFGFTVSFTGIISSIIFFSVIFFLILLRNLLQIQLSKPIELLRGSKVGEKEPRTKWLLALIGLATLGGGYYIAVTTKNPLDAFMYFFIAVILVIVGTYCLFTAGSIVILKILRKNKNYYYKTSHFINVSGMIYRMKQNAAGLATICILSTMVLVMISSTVALYVGQEDAISARYPNDICIEGSNYRTDGSIEKIKEDNIEAINAIVEKATSKLGAVPTNIEQFQYIHLIVQSVDDKMDIVKDRSSSAFMQSSTKIAVISCIEDYKDLRAKYSLKDDEILINGNRESYDFATVSLFDKEYKVVDNKADSFINGNSQANIVSSYTIIVNSYDTMFKILKEYTERMNVDDPDRMEVMRYYYGMDLPDLENEKQIELRKVISQEIYDSIEIEDEKIKSGEMKKEDSVMKMAVVVSSKANDRYDFLALYGGLFFLGIFLGSVFIMATVLIMYYKQITEGYDDNARFVIMKKVGMTEKDVKKSIGSQVLMVFFLPLIVAGIHIAFAFPIISKLMAILQLVNTNLYIISTICAYLVFAVFYIVVYVLTARSYYKICNSSVV